MNFVGASVIQNEQPRQCPPYLAISVKEFKILMIIFRMTIVDLFLLETNTTVFVGPVEGYKETLENFQAKLFVDGELLQSIYLNGEFIMNKKHPDGHRAISTKQSINLTSDFVKHHVCELRVVEQSE